MSFHDIQQGTPQWHSLRLGVASGSTAKRAITSTLKRSTALQAYAEELASEIITGKSASHFEGNFHTRRGHALEPFARTEYEREHKVVVGIVGFFTNDDGITGCSPDGIVGESGVAEYKCLSAPKHTSAVALVREGKVPADYVSQCQHSVWCLDREWIDLHFYHPEIAGACIRIERSKKWDDALTKTYKEVKQIRDKLVATLPKEPDNDAMSALMALFDDDTNTDNELEVDRFAVLR